MSIGKIDNIELTYRNGTWYYGEKEGTVMMTNNKHLIHMMFLSEGKVVPYNLLSPLERKGCYDSEWQLMSETYPLNKDITWYYGEKGREGTIIKTNNKEVVNAYLTSMLLSKPIIYELYSPLENKPVSEWERMSNNYAL